MQQIRQCITLQHMYDNNPKSFKQQFIVRFNEGETLEQVLLNKLYPRLKTDIYGFSFISEAPAFYDVNGDEDVNARDVIALMKYIIGAKNIELLKADVNGDGKVNARDVITMMKMLISAED